MEFEMQLNKWYRFKDDKARLGFEDCAHQNARFSKFMKDGFVVTDKTSTGSISEIAVKNGTSLDVMRPDTMGYTGGGPIISFGDDEFKFFEEIPEEIEESEVDRDYACLVLSVGDGGYLIRQHHCTKEEAEGFASRWLHDNPKDEVVIIRALTRMTLKTTPSIVSNPF
ncbi:MAG: hypothetical protein [Enterobacter phage ENC9]|nr:MAG: hypothetical protein [Enterobacter phage ENC9]